MESDKHKLLKERATKWLRSRGCTDVRYEIPVGNFRIDVVGFRDDKPVIGIECGNVRGCASEYERNVPFPIFELPFRALGSLDADDGDGNNIAGCKPCRLNDYSQYRQLEHMTEEERKRRKRGKYPWTRGEGPAPWA